MKTKSGKNVFVIAGIVVIHAMILIVIARNLWHAIEIKLEINRLEERGEDYQLKIKKDSTIIEHLKYDDYLERYAREQYRLQGKNEDVYVVEE